MARNYTKGQSSVFPDALDNMSTTLTPEELAKISEVDNEYASSSFVNGQKGVFLFKEQVGESTTTLKRRWTGKSSVATLDATIYLQAYNITESTWKTLDANSVELADTSFTLTGEITDVSNYIDTGNWVYFRVIQSATKNTNVWTIAVVPDTQTLVRQRTAHCVSHWNEMMQYIVDTREEKNTMIAMHMGDVCNQNDIATEWNRASSGTNIILNNNMPMTWAVGNHDYDANPDGATSRNISYMETYLPYSTHSSKSWFGSSTWPANSMRNTYAVQTIAGEKWLFFALEFFPRIEAVNWANGVINTEAPDFVVVSTHGYLRPDGERMGWADTHGPGAYGLCRAEGESVSHSGVTLWNNLISQHNEIVLVFSGHTYPTSSFAANEMPANGGTNGDYAGHAVKTSVHANGNICTQVLCNFQNSYCYKEPWTLGKSYQQWTGADSPVLDETLITCTSRINPGKLYWYTSKSAHVSTAETEPEVGANWTSYWNKVAYSGCGLSATICFYEVDPDRRTITRYDYNPVAGYSPQNYPLDNYPTQQPDWHSKHSFTFKY